MVFSLFGRKEKSDARRFATAMPARTPDSTLRGPATAPSLEAQRELARLTAEKIDRIESEMIPGAGSGAPASTLPMAERRRSAAPPPLEVETAAVFDRHVRAEPAIEVNAPALPPELEEAAILFANAQPEAAVATLREVLARGGSGALALQAFRMLFDVLVVLGARDEYEARAIDFAARFERSPPPWPAGSAVNDAAGAPRAGTTIRFGQALEGGAQRALEQGRRASAAGKAVTLDFGQVGSIGADGADEVCSLVALLERGTGEVTVNGVEALHRVARAAIEVGRRDESDAIWRAALLALRLRGDQQGFDDLAIDYCVTFEISPPAWEPLPARFRTAAQGGQRRDPNGAREAGAPEARPPRADSDSFALRGELTGLIATELSALRAHAGPRSQVSICCRKLVRLDFVAAGELLNELVALAAQGKVALFDQPSAIVEALLSVMGIAELAEVRPRPH